MASKSKSGATVEERERFLKDNGYSEDRSGKGSHAVWVNEQMKSLALARAIEMPENLRNNPAQKAWEIVLPYNPASGTWKAIQKQAEWCAMSVETSSMALEQEAERKRRIAEFRTAREDKCTWVHAVKHALRLGQEPPQAPPSYTQGKYRM